MITRILWPLDGSNFAHRALPSVASLAKTHQASVVVYGCLALDELINTGIEMSPITFTQLWTEQRDELLSHLRKAVEELQQEGLEASQAWSSGRPVEKIVETAIDKGCDCIIMASHGRGGFRRWVMGSVTEGVLRRAPCPPPL